MQEVTSRIVSSRYFPVDNILSNKEPFNRSGNMCFVYDKVTKGITKILDVAIVGNLNSLVDIIEPLFFSTMETNTSCGVINFIPPSFDIALPDIVSYIEDEYPDIFMDSTFSIARDTNCVITAINKYNRDINGICDMKVVDYNQTTMLKIGNMSVKKIEFNNEKADGFIVY